MVTSLSDSMDDGWGFEEGTPCIVGVIAPSFSTYSLSCPAACLSSCSPPLLPSTSSHHEHHLPTFQGLGFVGDGGSIPSHLSRVNQGMCDSCFY